MRIVYKTELVLILLIVTASSVFAWGYKHLPFFPHSMMLMMSPVWLLAGLLVFVFWVFMLGDCLMRKQKDSTEKLVWVLVLLFTHVIGAVLYWLIVKRKK